MTNEDRKRQAVTLWNQRPQYTTANDVVFFYQELLKTRPELIPQGSGDPRKTLEGWIFPPR